MQTYFRNLILIISVFIYFNNPSQAQTFGASVVAGFNTAQIDGDLAAGYNKLGAMAGLRGIIYLSDKTELSIDLLFSQKGSRSSLSKNNANNPFKFNLNYVEVPVVFSYKDWLHEEGYYRLYFQGGLGYGNLINATTDDGVLSTLVNELNNTDINFLLGTTYMINENLGAAFRYVQSINLLYNTEKGSVNHNSLLGKNLNFHLSYTF